MKLELKMLESNDTSVASIWKKKCLDLFEVCQTLKGENEELRERCKDLITQGIQLADAVNQGLFILSDIHGRASHLRFKRRQGHGRRHVEQDSRVEGLGDDVFGS